MTTILDCHLRLKGGEDDRVHASPCRVEASEGVGRYGGKYNQPSVLPLIYAYKDSACNYNT
jgi:hypothetical protein